MRALLLAGIVISATSQVAEASIIFDQTTAGTYSYSIQTNGIYDIVALGASGGGAGNQSGGLGAAVEARFILDAGFPLTIILGSEGGIGGGGGGSFVFLQPSAYVCLGSNHCFTSYAAPTDLAIAGGGGGATLLQAGGDGQATSFGGAGGSGLSGTAGGAGGRSGSGGQAGATLQDTGAGTGGGGSNIDGDGQSSGGASGGAAQYGVTSTNPPFGGGGGAGYHAGGGGGGFSGGGGGGGAFQGFTFTQNGTIPYFDEGGAGGGGGSFVMDTALSSTIVAGGNSSASGEVRITLEDNDPAVVPEPASLVLLGLGVAVIVTARCRRPEQTIALFGAALLSLSSVRRRKSLWTYMRHVRPREQS